MARVPLLGLRTCPRNYRYLFTENDVGDAHIFRAMANAPELMQWYMRYSTRLWDVLPRAGRDRHPRDRSRPRAPYEWHQHVRLGRAAGVTDAEITAITDGDLAALDDRDGALVAYARGVVCWVIPAMRITTGFERTTTSGTVVGIAMLVSHYVATARTLDAVDVEPETAFVGWTP